MLAGGGLLCVQGRSPFAIYHPVIHLTFCPVDDKLDFCNYRKYRKLLTLSNLDPRQVLPKQ